MQKQPAAVELKDAICFYQDFPLLAGVNLAVEGGKIVVVTGPNGAGKTSLLKLCAGLLKLSSGQGYVFGKSIPENYKEIRRQAFYLSHFTRLYDDLNAYHNISFFLESAGINARENKLLIFETFEKIGLSKSDCTKKVADLSFGQKRKIAIATAYLRRPKLLLLDEPYANLDKSTRLIIDDLINSTACRGASVILTSHEEHPLEALAAINVKMKGGLVTEIVDSRFSKNVA